MLENARDKKTQISNVKQKKVGKTIFFNQQSEILRKKPMLIQIYLFQEKSFNPKCFLFKLGISLNLEIHFFFGVDLFWLEKNKWDFISNARIKRNLSALKLTRMADIHQELCT